MRVHPPPGLSPVLLVCLLSGCGSKADDLPGTYVGTLETSVQASRFANPQPGGGDPVANVTRAEGVAELARSSGQA